MIGEGIGAYASYKQAFNSFNTKNAFYLEFNITYNYYKDPRTPTYRSMFLLYLINAGLKLRLTEKFYFFSSGGLGIYSWWTQHRECSNKWHYHGAFEREWLKGYDLRYWSRESGAFMLKIGMGYLF